MGEQWYDGRGAKKAIVMVSLKAIINKIDDHFFELTAKEQEAVLNLLKTFED